MRFRWTLEKAAIALALAAPAFAVAGGVPKAVEDYEVAWRGSLIECRLHILLAISEAELRDARGEAPSPTIGIVLHDSEGKPIEESAKPPKPRVKADPVKCVSDGTTRVRLAYDKAVAASKRAPARAALKEHLIVTNAVLKGVIPLAEESRTVYESRQSSDARRLDELWERVKVEF